MAIHGAMVKKDGTVVNVVIGEDENDPVLVFSDLLFNSLFAKISLLRNSDWVFMEKVRTA